MTKPPKVLSFPDPRRIEEEAADWVARLASGEISPAERAQFEAWLRRSPAHREAWARMLALWQGTSHVPQLLELRNAVTEHGPEVARRRLARWSVGIAASVALAALGVLGFRSFQSMMLSTQSQTFATARGVQQTITLVDGSSMVLNVDSRALVRVDARARRIRLERGEAYFRVAHDHSRPFLVDTGRHLVRATGTAFSVSVAEGRIEVLVEEGRVELMEASKANLPARTRESGARERRVTPLGIGQRAVVETGTALIEDVPSVDLERHLSWREGVIVFAGEPLSEVVDQMSRYSGVPIRIEDEELRSIPVGGRFRVGDVDSMLEALESVFGVEVRRDSDGVAHISVRR